MINIPSKMASECRIPKAAAEYWYRWAINQRIKDEDLDYFFSVVIVNANLDYAYACSDPNHKYNFGKVLRAVFDEMYPN